MFGFVLEISLGMFLVWCQADPFSSAEPFRGTLLPRNFCAYQVLQADFSQGQWVLISYLLVGINSAYCYISFACWVWEELLGRTNEQSNCIFNLRKGNECYKWMKAI